MTVRTIPNDILLGEVRRMVAAGQRVTLRTKGNSMLPFIRGGEDSVVLERATDYRRGDILLCEVSAGRYVLHRLLHREGETLVLMGDGNLKATERCLPTDVAGRVTRIVKGNGKEVDCNTACERLKASLWRRLLPLRRYLLAVYRRVTR